MIRVDAIGVGYIQVIENPDSGNQHIITAGRMQSPERCISHDHTGERNVIAVFHIDQSWSRIEITGHIIRTYLLYKGIGIAVDGACT